MAKFLTFTAPNPLTRKVEEAIDTLTARVIKRDIRTAYTKDELDALVITTTVTIVVGEFDASNNLIETHGPFKEAWPGAWNAALDSLDTKVLQWVANNKVPDGNVT